MRVWLSLVVGLLFAGCGDDDGAPADSGVLRLDSGPDSGRDAGPRDAGGGMDAGMDAGRARLTECDIFAPDCAEGLKCAVVLDRNDPENVELYFGCVPESTGTKPAGVVCASLDEDATPDDTTDSVITDECAEGHFCWNVGGDPITRCRPVCGADTVECAADQFCAGLNDDPYFGVCATADNCDPIFQTGCNTDESCYFVRNTMDQFLGNCFAFAATDGGTGAVGEPCMYINNCQPGSQCLPDLLADGGLAMTAACRQLCAQGVVDGGMPPDAGPPTDGGVTGDCPTGQTCTDYPFEGTFVGPYIGGACR